MILVTGANGRVGGLVAKSLARLGERPRILVRDTPAARSRFGDAVEVFEGDLADSRRVREAVAGADAVFLCSPVHPDQVMLQGNVVSAAAAENAYVVKLSGLATFRDSFVDSGRWHAETEAEIVDAGLAHTFLHPYFFTQNLGFQLASARDSGVITSAIPDVPIAMVDVNDIAAVASNLLLDPSRSQAGTLALTGDRAWSHRELAGVFTTMLDRPVQCRALDLPTLEENLRRSGQPDWHIRILLQFNRAFTEGLGSAVDPAVEQWLERTPIPVETSLAALLNQTQGGQNPFPS